MAMAVSFPAFFLPPSSHPHTTTPSPSSSSSSSPSTQPCTPYTSPSHSPPILGGRRRGAGHASRPYPFSYNKLIKTHVQNRELERALVAFSRMLCDAPSLLPDSFTFPPVFKACAELAALGVGEQAHCWVLKTPDASHNVFVLNSLTHMYARCGEVGAARKVFERMPSRNVVSWNSLIGGYVRNCMFGEAMDLFAEMLVLGGFQIDESTLVSVCSAVSSVGLLDSARMVHGYLVRCGYSLCGVLGVALIDMYSKCANVQAARNVFGGIKCKGVGHWTSMIFGFGSHGRPESALELFLEMQECGVRPNHVTFLGVLTACSHGGLLGEGLNHFRLMKSVYGIVPGVEHYGCLVDLLGRSGHVDEAKMVIENMPMDTGVVIWSSLLAACRSYGRIEMAEFAAQKLVELAPEYGGCYALLSDLYARFDRWEDFCRMRKFMDGRGTENSPGFSWIEVDGEVHQFTSKDKLHPLSGQIYGVLKELESQVDDTGFG